MKCWGITDGHLGMISQVEGLAQSLGFEFEMKVVKRRAPWVWFPGTWPFNRVDQQITESSDSISAPFPDVVITCGRRQIPYSLWIKKQSPKTITIHIQNPRISFDRFDLVIAPEHDGISGENVIVSRGAVHKVNPDKIKEAAKAWAPRFGNYPRPYHVVLLGGSTNRYKMDDKAVGELIATIKGIAKKTKGSVLVTPSYRTPQIERFTREFCHEPRIYFADLGNENPYLGLLGLADYMFVTNDSVNMMCEASVTRKPLYLIEPREHKNTVPARFSQELVDQGIARFYEGEIEDWDYEPYDETKRIAKEVLERIKK